MIKLWTIAWKELYTRFTDRNLILIMIATPLAISTIIDLAFGGLGGGDAPIRDIPALLINHDRGSALGVNYGDLYVSLLVPGSGGTGAPASSLPECALGSPNTDPGTTGRPDLQALTKVRLFDVSDARALVQEGTIPVPDANPSSTDYVDLAARAAVERGTTVAAIIIPVDFSARLTSLVSDPELDRTKVTVFGDPGRPVSAEVIRSIVTGITNQVTTASIAFHATLAELQEHGDPAAVTQLTASLDVRETLACALSPQADKIRLDVRTIERTTQDNAAARILVSAGASQAMFFALFTAQYGVLSMYFERRNWTLQRLIVSPTPRIAILGGKLVGTFASVLFQLTALGVALTLVGSLIQGKLVLIWGAQPLHIAIVLLSASLSVSGLGMLLAGVARSPEQAQILTSVLNITLAILGGAFGFSLPQSVSQLSLIYWGRDAFGKLAAGHSDVWPNVAVLVAQGVLTFGIGLLLFNRRFDSAEWN